MRLSARFVVCFFLKKKQDFFFLVYSKYIFPTQNIRLQTTHIFQVKELQITLAGLEAKNKERVWLRNQSTGDLDDAKLIEGLAGEQTIFRKRGNKEPIPGAPQVSVACV